LIYLHRRRTETLRPNKRIFLRQLASSVDVCDWCFYCFRPSRKYNEYSYKNHSNCV